MFWLQLAAAIAPLIAKGIPGPMERRLRKMAKTEMTETQQGKGFDAATESYLQGSLQGQVAAQRAQAGAEMARANAVGDVGSSGIQQVREAGLQQALLGQLLQGQSGIRQAGLADAQARRQAATALTMELAKMGRETKKEVLDGADRTGGNFAAANEKAAEDKGVADRETTGQAMSESAAAMQATTSAAPVSASGSSSGSSGGSGGGSGGGGGG